MSAKGFLEGRCGMSANQTFTVLLFCPSSNIHKSALEKEKQWKVNWKCCCVGLLALGTPLYVRTTVRLHHKSKPPVQPYKPSQEKCETPHVWNTLQLMTTIVHLKTKTTYLKDPACAIFLENRGFQDIKYDILTSQLFQLFLSLPGQTRPDQTKVVTPS